MTGTILDAGGTTLLRRFAHTHVLLAFDFDGTLAPLVPDREDAALTPETRALLQRVAALYPTVVISGRGREDVARRLEGIPLIEVVGSHGLDRAGQSAPPTTVAQGWKPALVEDLRRYPKVEIEDKGSTLTAHFRLAVDPVAARSEVLAAAARLTPKPRIIAGEHSIDLLPRVGVNKGTALRSLMADHRADAAIYVGDDATDEDAFALHPALPVLAIRVGRSRTSKARYSIPSQRDVNVLLHSLVNFRDGQRWSTPAPDRLP